MRCYKDDIARDAGFTLIEVLAAVAILGVALFVLLDAHYTAMMLNDMTDSEVTMCQLVETAVAQAEVQVLAGELAGSGDFGARYPDCSWSYEAVTAGEDERILLYSIGVQVTVGEETQDYEYFFFNPGAPEEVSSNRLTGGGDATK